jgi:hypothetical protein
MTLPAPAGAADLVAGGIVEEHADPVQLVPVVGDTVAQSLPTRNIHADEVALHDVARRPGVG